MMGYIPNALTLLNLSFGVISLVYVINGDYTLAAVFIILAVLMDGMDGRVARYLKVTSELGKQMDSLSDMVSFGVAPALLVYTKILHPACTDLPLDLVVAVVFVLCGAFRLARFNILNINDYFVGIPITMAGGLVGLLSLLSFHLPPLFFFVTLPVLSYLMVCNIRVRKL
jgi:CDP-diacylglycerol--serine O-phosphatidyltransferase